MQFRSQTRRQEVRHAVEKSAMQKSAMKEQHNFQEGNIVKIQNSCQVEMGNINKFVDRVEMVITKLVEWVRVVINKVVYTTVGKAKNMVYVKQMLGQHTHKMKRDTSRQNKEEKGKERNIFLPEDINMSVEVVRMAIVMVVRMAIMEVVRKAIMEVVRTAIVEVVRTAITKWE
jgi:hypothetical protein